VKVAVSTWLQYEVQKKQEQGEEEVTDIVNMSVWCIHVHRLHVSL
jgi:hypothetical protein